MYKRKVTYSRRRLNRYQGPRSNKLWNSAILTKVIKFLPLLYILMICYSLIKWQLRYLPYDVPILDFLTLDEIIIAPIVSLIPVITAFAMIVAVPFIQGLLSLVRMGERLRKIVENESLFDNWVLFLFGLFWISLWAGAESSGVGPFTTLNDNRTEYTFSSLIIMVGLISWFTLFVMKLKGEFPLNASVIITLLFFDLSTTLSPELVNNQWAVQAKNEKGIFLTTENSLYIGQTKNWLFTRGDSTQKTDIIAIGDIHKIYFIEYEKQTSKQENRESDVLIKPDSLINYGKGNEKIITVETDTTNIN